jgi:hypothetical protein
MAAAVTFNLTFYNQSGQVAGQYSELLQPFGHDSFNIKDKVSGLENTQGTMVITGQGVVPLGFRFNANNTFMTWLP